MNDIKNSPLLIQENNISLAWGRAILLILDNNVSEITPLIISVTGFNKNVISEHLDIRHQLDLLLKEKNKNNTENVAFTIFPERIWKIARGNRQVLWKLYKYSYESYKKMNPAENNRGLYFQRLIDFGCIKNGNQLEWILSQYKLRSQNRRSMFQASIFDPARDHVPQAQLQFPCMQQISFVPSKEGLIVNAFYATQQLFYKAYGNYLGISQLGMFMAHEMNMDLYKVNIMIGVAKLDGVTKKEFKSHALYSTLKNTLK